MKHSNDAIGNRTNDLWGFSSRVPLPTAPPRTPQSTIIKVTTDLILQNPVFSPQNIIMLSMPDTCRSHLSRCLRRGSAAARLLALWVRIPPAAWMSVSCECCVLSGRGLCVGADHSPRGVLENYGVSECDREVSVMRRPWPTRDCCAMGRGDV
jgi:hypothetical protein